MSTTTITLATVLITAVIGPLSGMIVKYWVDKKQKNLMDINETLRGIQDSLTNHSNATRNIIRIKLVNTMNFAMKRGFTTTVEFQEITNLYDSYKKLNGNSVVDRIFLDYSKLPINNKGEHYDGHIK